MDRDDESAPEKNDDPTTEEETPITGDDQNDDVFSHDDIVDVSKYENAVEDSVVNEPFVPVIKSAIKSEIKPYNSVDNEWFRLMTYPSNKPDWLTDNRNDHHVTPVNEEPCSIDWSSPIRFSLDMLIDEPIAEKQNKKTTSEKEGLSIGVQTQTPIQTQMQTQISEEEEEEGFSSGVQSPTQTQLQTQIQTRRRTQMQMQEEEVMQTEAETQARTRRWTQMQTQTQISEEEGFSCGVQSPTHTQLQTRTQTRTRTQMQIQEEVMQTETETQMQKRKRRRKKTQTRRCRHCGTEKTPQWRMGPEGSMTLCNACGVRYRSGRLLPEYRPASSPTFSTVLHSNRHCDVIDMRRKKREEEEETPDESGLDPPV
ncbi:unnamed protein product [Cochlearia groenlandica]